MLEDARNDLQGKMRELVPLYRGGSTLTREVRYGKEET